MPENERNFYAVFYKFVLGMLLTKTCAVINQTKNKTTTTNEIKVLIPQSAYTISKKRIVEKLEIFLDLLDLHDLKENFEMEWIKLKIVYFSNSIFLFENGDHLSYRPTEHVIYLMD